MEKRENYNQWGMNCHLNNTNSYMQTAMGWLHDGDGLDASNQDGFITYCESHEKNALCLSKIVCNGATLRTLAGYCNRVPLNTAFNVQKWFHMMWMFQN